MTTHLVKIGNSQGIRIPRILLEQTGLRDEVEIEVQNEQLIIRAKHQPRKGWADAFKKMAENGDDQLLDKDCLPNQSSWDEKEWEW